LNSAVASTQSCCMQLACVQIPAGPTVDSTSFSLVILIHSTVLHCNSCYVHILFHTSHVTCMWGSGHDNGKITDSTNSSAMHVTHHTHEAIQCACKFLTCRTRTHVAPCVMHQSIPVGTKLLECECSTFTCLWSKTEGELGG